jgi:hypothetical protein
VDQEARGALGVATFDSAWDEGRELPLEEAMAAALERGTAQLGDSAP